MQKYLGVKLKNGEYKKYLWDDISFGVENKVFVIWVNKTGEMLLRVHVENVLYYERVMEHGE